MNWMRAKVEVQDARQRADEQRLGQPRHALEEAVALARRLTRTWRMSLVLAHDHRTDALVELGHAARQCVQDRAGIRRRFGLLRLGFRIEHGLLLQCAVILLQCTVILSEAKDLVPDPSG